MTDPSRVRVSGPLACYRQGFGVELSGLGYTPNSVAAQLYLMAHLSRWMGERGLEAGALDELVAGDFLSVRRAAGYVYGRSVKALVPLVAYLRGLGAVPPARVALPASAGEAVLERYRGFLLGERAMTVAAARGYVDSVRPLVIGREVGGTVDLAGLGTADITAFVVRQGRRLSPKSAQRMTSALRSFLRFLAVEGVAAASLAGAVPSVANWRLAGLPRALGPVEVAALLASCDRSTGNGLRDYAVLSVLARLGLRAGEVAGMRLEDLDWLRGEIVVRGKGGRGDRLPLPVDVGAAVAGYLSAGRPAGAGDRCVFVRVKAPHRGLTSTGVTQIVAAAGHRAGVGTVYAHRLRHSAATGMVRAGAPLAEIGQVLRHRRALTTAIYAKVDCEALRGLARPWPAGAR